VVMGARSNAAAFLAFVLLLCALPNSAAASCASPANSIEAENCLAGTPPAAWDIATHDAGDPSIQGYATQMSVDAGGTVAFKVKTDAAAYQLYIYRLGYYGGLGARYVETVQPSAPLPQLQPNCLTDAATGLIDCGNWAISASWAVPATAISGVYVAKLVRTDTGGASHVLFVVRNDASTSSLVFQTSDTTWQAYNTYGGNSLYQGVTVSRAYKVSYNRPVNSRGNGYQRTNFFATEIPMIRWLEANGYDVTYISGVDTARAPDLLLNHRIFLSVGHDEYWSASQRAGVESARAAGVNLAFFSGNEIFWKTRWEPSIDGSGTAYRTLVSYKETMANAKIDPNAAWTGTWRDPRFSPPADGGRPENALSGTIFMVNCCEVEAITVPSSKAALRFWRDTPVASLAAGAVATLANGTLGYEFDECPDNGFRPPGLFTLSSTTLDVPNYLVDYGSTYAPGTATHSLTLYRHSSGALVFGAGTIRWAWGLDATHDYASPTTPSDRTVQQATVNLLADMGAQPTTLQAGLVAATPSADTTPPASQITSPGAGASVVAGSIVSITGTATDADGVVASVEVSTDGGTTWHPAIGQGSWAYSWRVPAAGPMTLLSRAVDDSGNLEAPHGIAVTLAAPLSITTTAIPNGSVGVAYSSALTATGGSLPVTWSVAGGALPPGLTVNTASGLLSGTPTTPEPYSFVVQVSDSSIPTQTATQSLSVTISPLVIATGRNNTAYGVTNLGNNTTGIDNTAFGYAALFANTAGNDNTATGDQALTANTVGSYNTATGVLSLSANTSGTQNTGNGYGALYSNTTGGNNNATGLLALALNTTGNRNNASGTYALYSNTTASDNNAMGYYAMEANTTGTLNNVVGAFSLAFNTTGNSNNAVGYGALYSNTVGSNNSAQGFFALGHNTTGSGNIAVGLYAGFNQTTGSNNIYIGSQGVGAESSTIRIGDSSTQNAAYIAGVTGINVMGVNVVVNSSGQLGVVTSSRRYKEDIEPLGEASERVYGLRPVTFRYKQPDEHGQKPLQYGLIAEEVAATFPELVVYNDKGQPETVRYQALTPILLNEVQQQRQKLAAQASQLGELKQQFAELQELNRAMQVALAELQAKESRVALR